MANGDNVLNNRTNLFCVICYFISTQYRGNVVAMHRLSGGRGSGCAVHQHPRRAKLMLHHYTDLPGANGLTEFHQRRIADQRHPFRTEGIHQLCHIPNDRFRHIPACARGHSRWIFIRKHIVVH